MKPLIGKIFLTLIATVFTVAAICWVWKTPVFADGTNPYIIGSGSVGGDVCLTPSDNLLDEGFEGVGYENAAKITESGIGTINEDTARPGSQTPTELCNSVLYVETDSGNEAFIIVDEGTQRDDVYFRIYYYLGTQADGTYPYIVHAGEISGYPGSNPGFNIQLYTDEGEVRARGTTSSNTIAINIGSWNLIEVHYVRNDTSWIQVNGGSQETFTAYDHGVRYYHIGHTATAPTDTMSSYFDLTAINTTGIGGE
jgi:hypothetical protein